MTPLGTFSTLIEKPSSPPSVMYAVIGTGPAAVCAVITWRLGVPGISTLKPVALQRGGRLVGRVVVVVVAAGDERRAGERASATSSSRRRMRMRASLSPIGGGAGRAVGAL